MKPTTVLLVLSTVVLARAQMEGAMKLCGRRLSDARELLCYGQNEMKKRNSLRSVLATINEDEHSWELEELPWSGKRAALGARWARHKRGLVDECCFNSCTVDQILSYC